MARTCFETRGIIYRRTASRLRLAASVVGLALLAGISAAQAQKLTVWSGYPEMEPFYRHVADGMKAKFPKLEVSVEAIPLREHEKRVALALASGGNNALVIELNASSAARYANNDLLPKAPANVTAFVNNPANFSDFFRDRASLGGVVYGVPLFRGQVSLFYNLDMFKAAGLTKPPATMDEYNAYAEKLTQRDASGKATVSGWSLRLSGGGQGVAEKFWINLFQYGGNILTQTADGKWKSTLANEAGRKALKQYLVNIHKTKTVSPEMPADAEAFERGQTAMFIRESWVIGDIAKKAPNLNYATAPLPRGSMSVPVNLYVSAKGAEAEAAWAFSAGRRRAGQSALDAEERRLAAEPRRHRLPPRSPDRCRHLALSSTTPRAMTCSRCRRSTSATKSSPGSPPNWSQRSPTPSSPTTTRRSTRICWQSRPKPTRS